MVTQPEDGALQGRLMACFCNIGGRKETEMPLVCKTLVLIEDARALKLVARAFPYPKYELEFVDTPEEASARAVSNRMDLFIVDSKHADDPKIESLKCCMPTMFVQPEYVHVGAEEDTIAEESDRMRTAVEKLLRKNYINWIIDALEYSS